MCSIAKPVLLHILTINWQLKLTTQELFLVLNFWQMLSECIIRIGRLTRSCRGDTTRTLPPDFLLHANDRMQSEWRSIGVQQSRGWVHYAIHRPEPHIMLFRRPLNYGQPQGQQAGDVTAQAQGQPTAA